MKKAFTLAEVLITLGIIGVVASMTIPDLVLKYQKKQTAIAVKKAYSDFTQALKLSEVEHGDMKYWNFTGRSLSYEENLAFCQEYIEPYFKGLKFVSKAFEDDQWDHLGISAPSVNYALNNGTVFSILAKGAIIYVLIDVNGYKKPNKMGNDVFYFNTRTGSLMPSGWLENLTREMILSGYTSEEDGLRFSCKKSKINEDDDFTDERHACTSLLMLDGWEFKDDYPW